MATRRSTRTSRTSALGLPEYLDVAPRHGTLRNFDNPTYGGRLAKVHRLLTGKNPMPWQQYVYDVLGEVDPKSGLRVYREGELTTMRQVGKTTNIRVFKAHRAIDDGAVEPQTILFAAQDGIEAKNKWLEHAHLLKRSPLATFLAGPDQPITSNGKEDLVWANRSSERPISSRPSSGHGETLDLGVVTEAFALVDGRYDDTMLFAMNNRPDAQLIVESTEGTAESLYWNPRVDELRARLSAEPAARGRVASFDWSFGPDDDPGDPATWRRRIPSLGHTLRLEEVQYAYERATTPVKMRQFMRGFGNVRDLGAAAGSMFEPDVFEAGERPDSAPVGPITFSLEIAPDRSWSTIGIAGLSSVRGMHVGLAYRERGTQGDSTRGIDSPVEYLARKSRELGIYTVFVAAHTPAALVVDDLMRAGLTVIVLSRAETAAACAGIYDDILAGEISYTPGQVDLEAAVAGAVWTGGDVRLFSRGASAVDVSPLYAVAIARYGSILAAQETKYDPLANIF